MSSNRSGARVLISERIPAFAGRSFGDVGNPTGLYTTPRDMVKLGQLLLDKGVAYQSRPSSPFPLHHFLSASNGETPFSALGRRWPQAG